VTNVRRVGAAKLLADDKHYLTQNFTFSQHIDAVVTVYNQRLYLLAQETPRTALDSVLTLCAGVQRTALNDEAIRVSN